MSENNNWMPIESAPRDGTRILAACEGCDAEIVRWDDDYDLWRQPDWEELENPDYWQPLPPPPTAETL